MKNGNGKGRHFEDRPAVRASVPLLVGLYGPSGGGKTYSALRLASGIQRVSGGEIYVIDTEARRALHYADQFTFRHLEFGEPFGPLDYLAAIEHCVEKGAGVVVVDSMSHEHEGPGGVLEKHEDEVERMGGAKHNFRAWAKPKAERRRLINRVLQLSVNAVFCFRAKEKAKPAKNGNREDLQDMGWMPIAGEEFLYEMTVNALLPPGVSGVPEWNPEREGERKFVKLPEQFRGLFSQRRELDEQTGEAMARWARGEQVAPAHRPDNDNGAYRLGSGSHQGKLITDPSVPADYLAKLADLDGPKNAELREHAQAELARREAEYAERALSEQGALP